MRLGWWPARWAALPRAPDAACGICIPLGRRLLYFAWGCFRNFESRLSQCSARRVRDTRPLMLRGLRRGDSTPSHHALAVAVEPSHARRPPWLDCQSPRQDGMISAHVPPRTRRNAKRDISTPRTCSVCALPSGRSLFQLACNRPSPYRPPRGGIGMKLGTAIAEIMKREGIEILCGYPVNHLIEHAANANIRPIMVRQERIGLHMADAISRVTSGRSIGAFCMQHGPGAENAMGGVAQCFGESVPVLVLPMGYARRISNIEPNFNSSQAMRAFAKSSEPINLAAEVGNIFRRAFTKLKNGRGGPVIVEIPADMWNEEVPEPLNYTPVLRTRYGADPVHVKASSALLLAAQRPVIYAGQGVHYAKAWPQLKRLAERLAIPVTTSLGGKSSFPETHPLSLGSGGLAVPRAVPKFLAEADVIFGIGCSFTETSFGIAMPKGKTIIHSTLDPNHLNKDVEARIGLVGDAGLVLEALLEEIGKTVTADRDGSAVAAEIAASHKEWLAKWMPKLTSNDAPLNPYRVLWDLQHTVDIRNTIITHDAGSPRDQLSPFWKAVEPLSYIGWGNPPPPRYRPPPPLA